ncbi:hypothetical protein [Actinomyces sp. Marseille-P3109]|uniref:hypothetical protein n=1 Tax=Actinomyces sp. Marseille-P3109 TaxID=2083009 RepID=UPI001F426180|nr:hypothetical protein [Actinomyces sp. Marseille-P3109]
MPENVRVEVARGFPDHAGRGDDDERDAQCDAQGHGPDRGGLVGLVVLVDRLWLDVVVGQFAAA